MAKNTNKTFSGGTKKGLYKDGVKVTDEAKIREQASEFKDSGSFAEGYEAFGADPTRKKNTVILKDGSEHTLSDAEMKMRERNLKQEETLSKGSGTGNEPEGDPLEKDGEEKGFIDDLKDAKKSNDNLEEKFEEAKEKKAEDDEAFKDDKIESTKQYFKDAEAIIDDGNKELEDIENKQIEDYKNRINRDSALLDSKKEAELANLSAEREYQRQQNEATIRQAKINVEIERVQSAWAYNKIGLGFSSGIINQSQQIATDGIVKIAEIKAKMTLDEANSAFNIAKVEFDYSTLVNGVVDKYTDAITGIKTETKKRINETNANKLKNNFDKFTLIEETKKWYRDETRNAERQHLEDIERVRDKGLELSRQVEVERERQLNIGRTAVNDAITNGTIYNMPDSKLVELAQKSGISINEINTLKNNSISSSIGTVAQSMMGEDFILSEEQRNVITPDVKTLIQSGKSLQEATEIATKKLLGQTPEYKEAQELEKLKTTYSKEKIEYDRKLIVNELNNLGKSTSGSGSGTSAPKTYKSSDFSQLVDGEGNLLQYNEITNEVVRVTEDKIEVRKVPVGTTPKNYLNQDGIIYADLPVITEVPVKASKVPTLKTSQDDEDEVSSFLNS